MSNYIVTGAAGFIGSRVCELLIADGHTVSGIDNLCDAYDVRLKQIPVETPAGAARVYFSPRRYHR